MVEFDFRTAMEHDIVDNMNVRDDLKLCDLRLTTRWNIVVDFLAEVFSIDVKSAQGEQWMNNTQVDVIYTLNDKSLYDLHNIVTCRWALM